MKDRAWDVKRYFIACAETIRPLDDSNVDLWIQNEEVQPLRWEIEISKLTK